MEKEIPLQSSALMSVGLSSSKLNSVRSPRNHLNYFNVNIIPSSKFFS